MKIHLFLGKEIVLKHPNSETSMFLHKVRSFNTIEEARLFLVGTRKSRRYTYILHETGFKVIDKLMENNAVRRGYKVCSSDRLINSFTQRLKG